MEWDKRRTSSPSGKMSTGGQSPPEWARRSISLLHCCLESASNRETKMVWKAWVRIPRKQQKKVQMARCNRAVNKSILAWRNILIQYIMLCQWSWNWIEWGQKKTIQLQVYCTSKRSHLSTEKYKRTFVCELATTNYYTVEPLCNRHHWDFWNSPLYEGVLN